MRVLFIASELKPFVQAGGVADVAGELPVWLRREGIDVEVIIPLYGSIRLGTSLCRLMDTVLLDHGGSIERMEIYQTSSGDVPITLIGNPTYFENGYSQPYVHSRTIPFYDDVLRFFFFSEACLPVISAKEPDIVHVHDWGPSFLLGGMIQAGLPQKRVLTVHNIGYQGNIGLSAIKGLPPEKLVQDARIEPLLRDPRPSWHSINPLRLGLETAHMVNTVSPGYCREITRPDDPKALFFGGQGLEEVASRLHGQGRLTGIINGFDPPFEPDQAGFDMTLEEKRSMKALVSRDFPKPEGFLVGFVGRASEQKCRLLMEDVGGRSLLSALLDIPLLNMAVLTSGTALYERFFAGFRHRPNFSLTLGFDSHKAEQIGYGCDLFLMPSLFEPCGIAQLASMSRATPPLVRSIGGLADTVTDHRLPGGTGFCFDGNTRAELLENLLDTAKRALDLKINEPQKYLQLQRSCYFSRFSWRRTAQRYIHNVYEPVLQRQ